MILARWVGACGLFFLVGCASVSPSATTLPITPPSAPVASVPESLAPQFSSPVPGVVLSQFAGRLSVTIESEPQQHISGEFELEGDAQAGELRLYGPVVGLVAVIQWEPGRAVLIEGDRKRVVKSLDWLIERVAGAPIPVSMVFDWLNQRPVASNDWWVEPRFKPTDRFRAVRLQPLPRMELLMVLKKAAP